jgi:16S rRNA (cytosine1402-N4)-methyltransferase
MLPEVIGFLNCKPGKIYIDGTIGGSGHAKAVLERIIPDGRLIGIDQDLDAIKNARMVLEQFESNTHLFHGNYIQIPDYLAQLNITAVDGILLDLGVSLHQLKSSGRGFSFQRDESLDMRMDVRSHITAEKLVNTLTEKELASLLKTYGEERWAKHIARKIRMLRKRTPIRSSCQLADIVSNAIPRSKWKPGLHPATKVFMALRIVVNDELERLKVFMKVVADYVNPGGRICILSFHSLEDRIVKQGFRDLEKDCICPPGLPKCICGKKRQVRILTKKGLQPSVEEIAANPMARSTRLRAAEKLI